MRAEVGRAEAIVVVIPVHIPRQYWAVIIIILVRLIVVIENRTISVGTCSSGRRWNPQSDGGCMGGHWGVRIGYPLDNGLDISEGD